MLVEAACAIIRLPYSAKPKKGVQKKKVLGFDMKYKEDRAKSGDFQKIKPLLRLALYGTRF